MLTNGFTCEEIASCAPGVTLKCIAAVVMHETSEVTFTAGQEYKVESTRETLMVVKNDKGQRHMVYGHFFRRHFTVVATASARQVVHLSETGPHAGRRFCGASRNDGNRSVHAMYAPLHTPEFRQNVCRACLETWATEAYEEGDPVPEYIAEVRRGNQPTAAPLA